MSLIIRLTATAVVVTLAIAVPASSHAGSTATPRAKNCFFVRNNLPCPCPKAQQARAVARAAHLTAGALGTAVGTTASALARGERKEAAPPDDRRKATSPAPPAKR